MNIDPMATTGSWYAPPPRTVEPTRAAPTRGDSCDSTCSSATVTDGSGLLEDAPGSVPFTTYLAKENRRGRVVDARADRAADEAIPTQSKPAVSKPADGPDLGWPKLGDAPATEEVRLVRVIKQVYRVERLTKPGTYLDMIG